MYPLFVIACWLLAIPTFGASLVVLILGKWYRDYRSEELISSLYMDSLMTRRMQQHDGVSVGGIRQFYRRAGCDFDESRYRNGISVYTGIIKPRADHLSPIQVGILRDKSGTIQIKAKEVDLDPLGVIAAVKREMAESHAIKGQS